MKKRVYIETSIVSYLVARPSRDLVAAAHQQITVQWWDQRRADFALICSQLVIDEAARGDVHAAARRLEILAGIPMVVIDESAQDLAAKLLQHGALPSKAAADALHIAIATLADADFLLTWNCTHIANAEKLPLISQAVTGAGLRLPVICTPESLLGADHGHYH